MTAPTCQVLEVLGRHGHRCVLYHEDRFAMKAVFQLPAVASPELIAELEMMYPTVKLVFEVMNEATV